MMRLEMENNMNTEKAFYLNYEYVSVRVCTYKFRRSEEDVRSPRAGLRGACESLPWVLGRQLRSPGEQYMLLTVEPSSAPHLALWVQRLKPGWQACLANAFIH